MTTQITLPEHFVITAKKGDQQVFLGFDSHSGGYPFWSHYGSHHNFSSLLDAVYAFEQNIMSSGLDYLKKEVLDVSVASVTMTFTSVSVSSDKVLQHRKAAALAKLTVEEKKILGLE